MATNSRILAWRMPWTEEPGGLQSMGSQRAGHDGVTGTIAAGGPHELVLTQWLGWHRKEGPGPL